MSQYLKDEIVTILIFHNKKIAEPSNACENTDEVVLRRNLHTNYNSQHNANKSRSVSLVDRLEKLQYSQNSWQTKVPEKDVRKFTVEGKMQQCPGHKNNVVESRKLSKNLEVQKFEERKHADDLTNRLNNQSTNLEHSKETDSDKSPLDSPARRSSARSSFRVKKTPKPINFKTSPPSNWIPSNETNEKAIEDESTESKQDSKTEQNEFPKVETSTVEVELPLNNDKGLSNFFGKIKEEKSEILKDCDFDLLLPAIAGDRHNAKLQHHKKDFAKNRKTQKRKPPTKNPLKTLAERSDILHSYKETSVTTITSDGKTLEIDTTKKHALAEKSKYNVF